MPSIETNGIQTSYLQAGEGPDLVMVHGLAANLAFWWWTVVPYLAQTHRVTVYDLRGHGHSQMPETGYRTDILAEDLRGLLDALDIERAHLVGHSLGGAISLSCALACPERFASLALVDCRVHSLQPLRSPEDAAYWNRRRAELAAKGVSIPPGTPRVVYSMLEELKPLISSGVANANAIPGLLVRKGKYDAQSRAALRWKRLVECTSFAQDIRSTAELTPERIRLVSQPVLLSYGADSACMPTCQAFEELLPDRRTVLHEGMGHFFPAVRPRLLIRDLNDFMAEVEGTPRAGESSLRLAGARWKTTPERVIRRRPAAGDA